MEIPRENSMICDLSVENISKVSHKHFISIAVDTVSGEGGFCKRDFGYDQAVRGTPVRNPFSLDQRKCCFVPVEELGMGLRASWAGSLSWGRAGQ